MYHFALISNACTVTHPSFTWEKEQITRTSFLVLGNKGIVKMERNTYNILRFSRAPMKLTLLGRITYIVIYILLLIKIRITCIG